MPDNNDTLPTVLDALSERTIREDRIVAYREYYEGEHDTQLTERQRRYLQLKIGEEFRANYCPIVVDTLAERLTLTGFQTAEDQASLLWQWWKANRMDHWQTVIHTTAIRDGDCYLLVAFDSEAQRPTLTFEPAYDGREGMKALYTAGKRGQVKVAFKRWKDDNGNARLNLYYADRIEKYIRYQQGNQTTGAPAWTQYRPDPSDPWPIPWRNPAGYPLGVPICHFRNNDRGYNYGSSELRDIIPMQNALNKGIIDLVAAADTTAFRVYWMLGDDPSGLEIQPGSWVFSTKPPTGEDGVSTGYFPGEDLSPLIAFKDQFAVEIARISRTPISYFQISGHRPAEGTLKQEESGLVAKAKNRQVSFGNVWEDAMEIARRLWNTFGDVETTSLEGQLIGTLDERAAIESQWADPQSRNEKELLETLKLKAELGVPLETLWAEMGYTAEEINRLRAQRGEELQSTSNVGGELLRAFEGGQ